MPRKTRTITVAELFEPIDIDFFGTVFPLRTPTRSGEEKVAAAEFKLAEANEVIAKRREAEEADPEQSFSEQEARKIIMPVFYEMLDLLLEPSETEGGKKTYAKTIVKKLYEDDKIGLATIQKLTDEISEVRAEEQRPT